MPEPGMTEFLIEGKLGCGAFQILQVIVLYVVSVVPSYCAVQMMSFGSYNPGWACLDNVTQNHMNETIPDNMSSGNHSMLGDKDVVEASCQRFPSCQRVHFDPSASTIVTEWNLVCDRSYIPSLIISIQMAGILVGSLFAGQLADSIGRKKAYYGSLFFIAILSFASAFSISWQMFAVIMFFMGVFCAGVLALYYVYPSEFLPRQWRAPLTGFPAWSMSGIFYGLITMALKNWRHFQATVGIMTIVSFMFVFWTPESLRWLEVKNKDVEYKRVVVKITKLNRMEMLDIENTTFKPMEYGERKLASHSSTKKYTYLDLLHPGYKLYTLILAAQWLSMNLVYVSITYGISILGGDFFTNLVVMNLFAVPFGVFPIFAPNILGRKKSLLTCYLMIALALGVNTCLELELLAHGATKNTGIIIMIMFVIACIESARGLIVLVITEIYPTVVRGLGVSWAKTVSRLGAIIAPLMIPKDTGAVYSWYLIMVFLALFCTVLATFLPETKGKPLMETFEPKEKQLEQESDNSQRSEIETTPLL